MAEGRTSAIYHKREEATRMPANSVRPSASTVILEIDFGTTFDSLHVAVSTSELGDLRDCLMRSGIRAAPVASASTESWLAAITVLLGTGGLASLSPALIAFMQRHKDKVIQVKIGSQETILKGYAAHDVERIVATLGALQQDSLVTGEEDGPGDSQHSSA